MITILSAAAFVTIQASEHRPNNDCGYVPYTYEMGVGEVSNQDYADFLNAVAARDDRFGLYSITMASHFWGGINRIATGGGFRYLPKPGYEQLPVTFVSFGDAARYANWLSYGRPAAAATEGTSAKGSYDTSGRRATRNVGANFVVPSCSEWAKAAYFNRSTGKFSLWATQSPTRSAPSGSDRSAANVAGPDGFANPFPHLVASSAYPANASGTQNQAGNVMEWSDTWQGEDLRMMGGSLFMNADSTKATYTDTERADHKLSTVGFRVARLRGTEVLEIAKLGGPPSIRKSATIPAPGEFVRVAWPNNERDPITGVGRVLYEFEIQRTEISNAAYASFLNAVARKADPARLFRKDMQVGVGGGIARSGSAGAWVYTAKPGWEDRAVTYLSWFALARMANWRHNGALRPGSSDLSTTEGTADRGAYDTRQFPFADRRGFNPSQLPNQRNRGARYFIPSNDEWYKAAYFDPALEGRRYWDYPTQSTRAPALTDANYQIGDALGESAPFYVAKTTAYSNAPSPSGTLQQGGNVWEWLEGWRSKGYGGCWRCDEWTRGLRGGSFNYTWRGLHAQNVDPGTPDQAYFVMGGRLARSASPSGWQPLNGVAATFETAVTFATKHKFLTAAVAVFLAFTLGFALALALTFIHRTLRRKSGQGRSD